MTGVQRVADAGFPTNAADESGAVLRFTAIGTGWKIDTANPLPDALRSRILELCEDFDRVWSRFRTDSLVAEIARATDGGRFAFPARDTALLDLYDRLEAATGGAVDPLIGRALQLLGYDADYTLIPDHAGLADLAQVSWHRDVRREQTEIVTGRSLVIDVGAAGKGYLVDLITQEMLDEGIEQFRIDGSGDLRQSGPEPVVVALQHPTRPDRAIGTVPLRDAALCASATSRRAWGEGLHHVLDGRTGRPVSDVVATWVLASDAAIADGLATALFVSDPASLQAFEFSWVRMLANGRVQWSNDFNGELFI